jgi:hypothetical protein
MGRGFVERSVYLVTGWGICQLARADATVASITA